MNLKPYPEYNDSKVQWIGKIPEGWDTQKMKHLSFFQEGPGLRNWQFTSKGIRVICVTNITEKGIDFTNYEKFISKEEYKQSYKHFTVEKGDLLLSSSGNSWGKVAEYLSEENVILNTSTIRINESQREKKVNRLFLKWALQSDSFREQLGLMMTGSCQPNFGPSHLSEAIMCFPKLINEQQSIALFLDKKISEIDITIEKDAQLIELLKEKRVALINHVVTRGLDSEALMKDSGVEWIGEIPKHWEKRKLKTLLKQKRDAIKTGPFGSQLKSNEMEDSEVKVYNQRNVISKDENFGENFVSRKKYEDLISFKVLPGDLLITTRGTIGKCLRLSEEADEGILHPCLMKINNNDKIMINEYLELLIEYSDLTKTQFFLQSNATTIEVIYQDNLRELMLLVPPIDEQKEILDYLDKETSKIDKTIQKIEKKINLMEEYKKSLIHHVVTGKTDVRGDDSLKQIHQKKDSKQTSLTI
ncbi:restriction endonuclease subunit S [Methanobacterium oryzae]|uniref:restriction endonuclease subunit S n=1 Tax=Methanobacterium oryzae TaxID=69540 RepID=UPI003D1BE223